VKKKKPSKVGEPITPYVAKKAAKPGVGVSKQENAGVRYMDDATFRKAADKVFKVHADLFRKLAH